MELAAIPCHLYRSSILYKWTCLAYIVKFGYDLLQRKGQDKEITFIKCCYAVVVFTAVTPFQATKRLLL